MPNVFRSNETIKKYKNYLNKETSKNFTFNIDGKVIKKWKYWFIRPDDFPYDLIADVHHLIIPIRKFSQIVEANEEELKELQEIKKELGNNYDIFIEKSFGSPRSIETHAHIHALKLKGK